MAFFQRCVSTVAVSKDLLLTTQTIETHLLFLWAMGVKIFYRDIMLETAHIRDVVDSGKPLVSAIILTWSCSPAYVLELFADKEQESYQVKPNFRNAKIRVFFQRWSYDDMSKEKEAKETYRNESCRSTSRVPVDNLDIRFYRCRKEFIRNFQLHTKSCIFKYTDHSIQFIQFSWNLNANFKPSLLFRARSDVRGLPKNTHRLLQAVADDRFLTKFSNVCNGDDAMREKHFCTAMFNSVVGANVDELCDLVLTLPKLHFALQENPDNQIQYTVFRNDLQQVLNEKKVAHLGLRFEEYIRKPSPAVLVSLFNFVDVRLLDSICNIVGDPFTLPEENQNPLVTAAYPVTFQDNTKHLHEKFVYKIAGANQTTKSKIQWVFFCSHNLTPASWKPVDGDPNGALEDSSSDAKNMEVGIFLFALQNGPPLWAPAEKYLIDYYFQKDKFVKFHQYHCRRRMSEGPRVEANALDSGRINRTQRVPDPARIQPCTLLRETAWQRYEDRKECLINYILPGCVGVSQLLGRHEFLEDNFSRYALYDYVFLDIAISIPWVQNGNYNMPELRGLFFKYTKNEPWFKDEIKSKLIVETLMNIFLLWGRTFDLLDLKINEIRPRIMPETLIDYDKILWTKGRKVPFLIDPKRITESQDNKRDVDPYESLSFLMQHMFEPYEIWWQCPDVPSHRFYWDVKSVFQKPQCAVCETSPEVRNVYETLRTIEPSITHITVEFPIFKRESLVNQNRLRDDYINRGYPVLGNPYRGDKLDISRNDSDSDDNEEEPEPVNNRRKKRSKKSDDKGKTKKGKKKKTEKKKNRLLCEGTDSQQQLLQTMRYDIFFVYDNKLVGIELDDPSHRILKDKGADYQARTDRPTAKQIHDADAVKNVVSWLMQVHVIRIATKDNDAMTLIPAIVKQVRTWVKSNKCKPKSTINQLHTYVLGVLNTLTEDVDGYKAKTALSIRNPTIEIDKEDQNKIYLDHKLDKPISCVINTSTRDINNVRDSVLIYLDGGRLHTMYHTSKPVGLCRYVDFFSLYYNHDNFGRFMKSRKADVKEDWYMPNTKTRIGTLYDSYEEGGVHVITKWPQRNKNAKIITSKIWHFDITKSFAPIKEELAITEPNWTNLWDPVRLVRLVSRFDWEPPTKEERDSYPDYSKCTDPPKLDEWIKSEDKKNWIWLAKADNLSQGKCVQVLEILNNNYGQKILRIDNKNGDYESDLVQPGDIKQRVYEANKGHTNKLTPENRSEYIPVFRPATAVCNRTSTRTATRTRSSRR